VSDIAQRDTRVFYRDIKPYDVPDQLEQLHGPRSGRMELPRNVYWGPEAVVDLDTVGGVMKAYQAALREGRVIDQVELLNRDLLIEVWGDLMLPSRLRELWESRFPELAVA
jgi:hypothetical protein